MSKFEISESCPIEQRRVFDSVNRAIETLGVAPDQFDVAFRCQLIRTCHAISSSAQLGIVKAMMDDPVSKPHVQDNNIAKNILGTKPTLAKWLNEEAHMEVHLKIPPDSAEGAQYLIEMVAAHVPSIITSQANTINLEIGRFQDLPASVLNDEQRKLVGIFKTASKSQTGAEEAMPKQDVPYTNLLQAIASGGRIANDKGKYNLWEPLPEFRMETGNTASAIRSAMIATINNLAEEKQLAPEKKAALQKECDKINTNILIMSSIQDELRKTGYNPASGELSLFPINSTQIPINPIERFQLTTSAFGQTGAPGFNFAVSPRTAAVPSQAPQKTLQKPDMRYTISDKVSKRQKRFFEALKKVQEASLSPVADFEFNLRYRLSLITSNSPAIAAVKLTDAINRDYGTSLTLGTELNNLSSIHSKNLIDTMPVTLTAGEKTAREEIEPAFNEFDIAQVLGSQLFSQMSQAVPVMTELKMGRGYSQLNAGITETIQLMEQRFKKPFQFFDKQRLMLGDFMNGSRQLHELSAEPIHYQWKQYSINMPSEQYFLEAAILDTVRMFAREKKFTPAQNEKLERAISEMQAAYAEAVMSPEVYAAKQQAAAEVERARLLEEQRKADEARAEARRLAAQKAAEQEVLRQQKLAEEALRIIPFALAGTAQGVLDKGNPARPLPSKPNERCMAMRYRDVVEREVAAIKSALNRNFDPHLQLGNALFVDDRCSVMRVIDTMCSKDQGAGSNGNNRQKAARALQQVLTLAANDSPVYKANQEWQQKLVEALMHAPVLITAAVGTHSQTQEQHSIYAKLFPAERKHAPTENQRARLLHRRGAIAMEAMQDAGITPPPELLEMFTKEMVPPAPPPEPEVVKPPPVIPPAAIIPIVAAAVVNTPAEPEVPPPVETTGGEKPDSNTEPPRTEPPPKGPVSVPELIRRMEDYILDHAEHYNQIRMHLRQNGEHVIVITLSDKDGRSPIPLYLDTERTDINEALSVFRQVQGQALAMEGLVNYVEPCVAQHTDPQMNERIPNVTPISRTQPNHGSYYVQLTFPAGEGRARSDMSINLGLPNTPDRLEEATRRAARVVELIEEQRCIYNAENTGPLLPVTKKNITDYLHQEIERFAGEWVYPESQAIEDFPPEMRIRSATNNCWLHIAPMRQSGMVDNSWVQPLQFVIDGKPLQEGNAEINTHINDNFVARLRAREIVEEMVRSLDGANFAIDPENPHKLRKASSAEIAADSTLVDLPRLRRLQGRIRSLYEQDVAIIERERTPDGQGNINFSLEMTRGRKHDVYEPMRESGLGHSRILRHFTVPESQADAITPFIAAIQQSVSDNLEAAYHPTTRREDSPDYVEREKPRLRFSPHYARTALEKAIDSAVRKHSSVQRTQLTHVDRADELDALRQGEQHGVA